VVTWVALYASGMVIRLGWALFRIAYVRGMVVPTKEEAYASGAGQVRALKENCPKFYALIYSLETFVPILDLKLADHWMPVSDSSSRLLAGFFRYYLWIHIIAGWILTTLWVGGFTGLIKG